MPPDPQLSGGFVGGRVVPDVPKNLSVSSKREGFLWNTWPFFPSGKKLKPLRGFWATRAGNKDTRRASRQACFGRFCQLDKITESLDSEKQQHKQAFLYNHELPTLVRNASSILIRFRARRRDKSAPAVAVDVSRLEEQFYVTPHFRYILSSII